ncbi:Ger(x)C family spore germination protein [Clostridium folliculivorans]|uniref:Germination protein n=1 Tax=Clostridium folliculivorans TaxID=2886038 RepID=A0A9W5Y1T9_9CLOT|nr:Ger(x)C family spore germination protein [Clostridium folliculivorans]GKU24965.1 germination protein [Clostridium folliculivorans]GKU31063.1 germination protein [Clostridium folliculivorans]
MKIRNKFILVNALVFLLSTVLTGCIDKTELNEIALVIGMGIDKDKDENSILVTLELANPTTTNKESSDSPGRANSSILQTSKGKNFSDALQNFTQISSLAIDFTHIQVIVMSKELCSEGVAGVVDYVSRDRQFRNLDWIFMAEDSAYEVLKTKMSNDDITSLGLANMMNKLRKNGSILPVDLNRFIIGFQSQAKASLAPVVRVEKTKDEQKGRIKIEKTAVFKNDRLVGVLTTEESKYLAWFYRKIKGNLVVSPITSNTNKENIVVQIFKEDTKIETKINEGDISFEIKCMATAEIKEMSNLKLDSSVIRRIENNTGQILETKLSELINKCQTNLNADVIGFAEIIYNNNPEKWESMKKDWDKIFPTMKYKVSFDVTLKKVGMTKDSPIDSIEEGNIK